MYFLVTGQGSFPLIKKGHADWSLLLPLLIGSVPSAFWAGTWRLPEATFLTTLASVLLLAGLAMLLQGIFQKTENRGTRCPSKTLLLGVGIGLGLLAGVTGIGGGIYLAPVMHLLGWARTHAITTCTSLFIVFNSVAGLAGQLTKGIDLLEAVPIPLFISLLFAVILGVQIGSFFLTNRLPTKQIRLITACVILLVAIRLWVRVCLIPPF